MFMTQKKKIDWMVMFGGILSTFFVPMMMAGGLAAPADNSSYDQMQRQKRMEQEQQARIAERRVEISLPDRQQPSAVEQQGTGFSTETFYVGSFVVDDCGTNRFQWLQKVLEPYKEKKTTIKELINLQRKLMEALFAKGYVTSQVLIPDQDYKKNVNFTFLVIPGFIEDIRFKGDTKWGTWRNAFPCRKGAILNSFDLEQGIETMRRAGNQEVTMEIVPCEKPGYSTIVLDVQRSKSLGIDISWDDAGQKSTGKREITPTLTISNPTGSNDILSIGYTKDTVNNDRDMGTHNNSFYYSVPMKRLTFTASKYHNTYKQTYPQYDGSPYQYEGKTDTWEIGINGLLYRDRTRKTEFISKFIRRHKRGEDNVVGRMENQELDTAAFQLGFNYRQYLGKGMTNLLLYWQKGIPGFGSRTGWEDDIEDGARTRYNMIGWSFYYGTPIKMGSIVPKFSTSFRGQWTKSKLYGADHMSIGGRYSVRGYNGENTFSAENGYVWRNELGFEIPKLRTEFYLGMDYGRVWGPSDRYNIRDYLLGAFCGLRGNLTKQLSYDVFIGTPIHKPEGFKAGKTAAGFSVNLSI